MVVVGAYSLPEHYGDIVGRTGMVGETSTYTNQWQDETGAYHNDYLITVSMDEPVFFHDRNMLFTELDFYAHELDHENVNL